ncbi:MAG: hypothetical protein R3320_11775, partial [Nitriliruptorales bacterium]|nr:hypothetical protein [Nitriliruptorales bacterium]
MRPATDSPAIVAAHAPKRTDDDVSDHPRLVLGPVQRYADEHHATVWVETDRPCEVEILGSTARTFTVAGHHYALVVVGGRRGSEATPYDVRLDGTLVWPEPDDPRPAPVIRGVEPDRPATIAFGSCRAAAPDEEPWTLPATQHSDGFGPDSLAAYSRQLQTTPPQQWPDLLLLLGDQVYADAASPATRRFARQRRDTSEPPYGDVADFEEYT